MRIFLKPTFLSIALLFCLATPAYALDVTLQWDANSESNLAGYKVYYKRGDAGGRILQNYNGKGAIEGDSPITMPRSLDENLDPGIVCLPGGHVRNNEGREEALRRELREELGIEVKGLKFVCKNLYVASNGERQNAYCFLITEYSGQPICKSAQEILWEDAIENLSLEVDRKTIRKLKELARVPK